MLLLTCFSSKHLKLNKLMYFTLDFRSSTLSKNNIVHHVFSFSLWDSSFILPKA